MNGQEYCQEYKNAKIQSKVWLRVLSRYFVGSCNVLIHCECLVDGMYSQELNQEYT